MMSGYMSPVFRRVLSREIDIALSEALITPERAITLQEMCYSSDPGNTRLCEMIMEEILKDRPDISYMSRGDILGCQ